MQTSPLTASDSLPDSRSTRTHEDLIYQVVTIAAILVVLGTLWAF